MRVRVRVGHLEHRPRAHGRRGGEELRAHRVVHERGDLVDGPVALLVLDGLQALVVAHVPHLHRLGEVARDELEVGLVTLRVRVRVRLGWGSPSP